MTDVTTEDLLDAIEKFGREQPKRPPGKNWMTMREMAKRKGLSYSALRFRFTQAIEKGMQVERFVGSDFDPTGRLVKQTWFRVKR